MKPVVTGRYCLPPPQRNFWLNATVYADQAHFTIPFADRYPIRYGYHQHGPPCSYVILMSNKEISVELNILAGINAQARDWPHIIDRSTNRHLFYMFSTTDILHCDRFLTLRREQTRRQSHGKSCPNCEMLKQHAFDHPDTNAFVNAFEPFTTMWYTIIGYKLKSWYRTWVEKEQGAVTTSSFPSCYTARTFPYLALYRTSGYSSTHP